MSFLEKLHNELDQYHLLKSPFYLAWNAGKLSQNTLRTYAKDYYPHVAAFPRYISAIHTNCDHLPHRQILLGNLIEEEQGEKNHPELWLRFAEGLGCKREDIQNPKLSEAAKTLAEGYFDLVRSDFAKGLGALYAYERQTPEISVSKIEGLKKFYNIDDPETLEFFEVHSEADEWHSEECANIINSLTPEQQTAAKEGAIEGAKYLWAFLEEMNKIHEAESIKN